MRTIHVYRAAHHYFVDGIYWGDDAEGVQFYLQVTGVPPEEITKALAQVEQQGTYTVEPGGSSHARAIRASAGGHEAGARGVPAVKEQLRHDADHRISRDLDDGVKVNYGKFGDLLTDVKAVTGGNEEP
jgi:hypothetical protein